jgi:hypothetical protein
MIPDSNKTSLLIPSQLPEFIRDDPDYSKFVLFLQAYYEWLEENHNVTDRTKNILNYIDIDKTSDEFLDYFYNDFLQYFPKDILANKKEVTKIAKQLYQTKGTPASYKFLFRVLYNSDVDFFYTKDAVLRASAGKWYVPRSLKLLTSDRNFLNVTNYKIFGETTKSLATIENALIAGSKIEVFISDIERTFQSGEFVRVVYANNQPVLFNNQPLRAKVVGQISQIKIDSNNRGVYYKPNDPVVVYGGLNSANGHGAIASIANTTSGSIQRITTDAGGFGYTFSTANSSPGAANTFIQFTNLGIDSATPIASVGSVIPNANSSANVTLLPIDYIGKKANTGVNLRIDAPQYHFSANPNANLSTKLINALTFTSFQTFPISSVIVNNSGGGISQPPIVTPQTLYSTEPDSNGNLHQSNLRNFGILAPIQIVNAGIGYAANDKIIITGGRGYGAAANVLSVNSSGSIMSVGYVYPNGNTSLYPIGGMGYNSSNLPTLSISSANGANAIIQVTGVLGDGAKLTPIVDRVGSITSISISDFGEDYVATPNVSIRIQDLIVKGLTPANLPVRGDAIYQGANLTSATYTASVDSITVLNPNAIQTEAIYTLRVFNYNSNPVYTQPLKINAKSITANLTNQITLKDSRYDSANGILSYGDGTAKANATFLNGLVIGSGQYLDTTGQPSSFDILQNEDYNNYTYEITVEKEISKYRDILLNLLHPTGMKVLGRYGLNSSNGFKYSISDSEENGHNLSHYTGSAGSYALMIPASTEYLIDSGYVDQPVFQNFNFGYETDPITAKLDFQSDVIQFAVTDFSSKATNIVYFGGMANANLGNIVSTNNTIQLTTSAGDVVYSEIKLVNAADNYILLKDYVWLTYGNVATVSGNANSSVINILSLTGAYDYFNNGNYTDPNYPLKDVLRAGDSILVANNIPNIVLSVDYTSNIAYLESNLANTVNSSLMSVGRTYITSNVQFFGPVGIQYFPEITTENEYSITTEDGQILILG